MSVVDKEDEISRPYHQNRAPDMPVLSEEGVDEQYLRKTIDKPETNKSIAKYDSPNNKPKDIDSKNKEDKAINPEQTVDLTQGEEQTLSYDQKKVELPMVTEKFKYNDIYPQTFIDQSVKQEKSEKKRNYDADYLKRYADLEYQKKTCDISYQKKMYDEYHKRIAESEYQKKHLDLLYQKKSCYDDYQKRICDPGHQKRSYEDTGNKYVDFDCQKRNISYNEYHKRNHSSDNYKHLEDKDIEVDSPKKDSISKDTAYKSKGSPKSEEREHKRTKPEKEYSKCDNSTIVPNKISERSPPPVVVIDDSERNSSSDDKKIDVDSISGNTTPRLDHSVEAQQPATPINPGSVKQTPPQPEIPSMGVYTPDSTTNSVHSLHGYGQCDLDVSQLGLESPTSISSNDMPPSVGAPEPPRPPSSQAYTDCAQQSAIFHHHHATSSPQHCPPSLPQYQTVPSKQSSSRSKSSQSASQHHSRNRSTPPAPSPVLHRSTPPQQPTRHHQQPYPHHHPHHAVVSQPNYSIVPQMQTGTYAVGVPMATVIQHRMTQGPQPSPNQRVGSSPSCSVSTPTNFYIQNIQPTMHPHSHTPTLSPTTCASGSQTTQSGTPSCSLAKLQQLTNGLDMIPPGHCANMTPPPPMNLTPPPSSHPTMTPPPSAHQMLQQSNLSGYHKFYPGNMAPASGRSSSRSSSVQMPPTSSSSRSGVSPNVTLNHNLMSGYQFNGYRMAGQQSPATVTGYIANTAGFINQGQIPVQMGVMNMAPSQYAQDPTAIQQNTMYTTYGYINSNLINGTLRR